VSSGRHLRQILDDLLELVPGDLAAGVAALDLFYRVCRGPASA